MLSSKACDITGIVAIACARHGCFAPNSIVDLFRGEQQKNVDWSFLEAIRTTNVDPDQGVMYYYDIMCQYWVYFMDRIGYLLPSQLKIDRAIGLFHVHGHKEECFYRFASSFIPEAGVVAGEILESLWSRLNLITTATRTATVAHRAEVIDEHASDSNHKKMLGIGKLYESDSPIHIHIIRSVAAVLCDRFGQAQEMVQKTSDYFNQMSCTITLQARNKWEQQLMVAEKRRLEDPSAMDIIGAQQMGVDGRTDPSLVTYSGPEWLTLALSIEERQFVVLLII